jgi:ATP-dependent Clp protease, protease subunit
MEIQIPKPKERDLYLSQQVDQSSINSLTKSIVEINSSDMEIEKMSSLYGFTYSPQPIKIWIDSYGGLVYQCFGLLGIIENSKTPIHTIVTGCAMSCGFLISISGHKRFGYEKSTYLYHQVSGGTFGKVKDMEEDIIETKRLQKMIEEHTLQKTRIDQNKLQSLYEQKKDWFIDTKQALKLGIIDEVIR